MDPAERLPVHTDHHGIHVRRPECDDLDRIGQQYKRHCTDHGCFPEQCEDRRTLTDTCRDAYEAHERAVRPR